MNLPETESDYREQGANSQNSARLLQGVSWHGWWLEMGAVSAALETT